MLVGGVWSEGARRFRRVLKFAAEVGAINLRSGILPFSRRECFFFTGRSIGRLCTRHGKLARLTGAEVCWLVVVCKCGQRSTIQTLEKDGSGDTIRHFVDRTMPGEVVVQIARRHAAEGQEPSSEPIDETPHRIR